MKKGVGVITFKRFPGVDNYDCEFRSWYECSKNINKLNDGDFVKIHERGNIYLMCHATVPRTRQDYERRFRKSPKKYEDYIKDKLSCQYFFILEDGRPQDIL